MGIKEVRAELESEGFELSAARRQARLLGRAETIIHELLTLDSRSPKARRGAVRLAAQAWLRDAHNDFAQLVDDVVGTMVDLEEGHEQHSG